MTIQLISVIGNSPGVGKSTLCRAVANWLTDTGGSVDHFEEAEILSRPAFAAVAEEFAGGASSVRPETLVEATGRYVAESVAAGRDWLVTDALIPFLPSLVAWGHDEDSLTRVLADLARALEPVDVTVVYLQDDPDAALRRALAREGAAWERWYVAKLAGSPGTRSVHDLASAAVHLRRETELTHRLLANSSWHVLPLDVRELTAAGTYAQVHRHLAARLGPPA